MPPVRMRGDGRKAKNPEKTLLRLISYMKKYIPNLLIVLVWIYLTAQAQATGSENIGTLVDDFILPMVASGSADFAPLAAYLVRIAVIFAAGMIAAFLHQFLALAAYLLQQAVTHCAHTADEQVEHLILRQEE